MYTVYAVRLIDCDKQRFVIGSYETIQEAKHYANCATLGNADYAYVKDSKGGTLFYLDSDRIGYKEAPQGAQTRPLTAPEHHPRWVLVQCLGQRYPAYLDK